VLISHALLIHNLLDYSKLEAIGHLRSSRSVAATRSESTFPLAVGERVMIDAGPLLGREGIILEDRSSRVVLLVHLATRAAPVEMDRDCIRPAAVPPQSADTL
jgi:transcription antitermination factor NusG